MTTRKPSKAFRKEMKHREQADIGLYLIAEDMKRLAVYDKYLQLLATGESPKMAAMIASRKMPGIKNTDTQFVKRERSRMADMSEHAREEIVKIARRAGINTTGKTYSGELGKYGDAHAWVSDTSDVRSIAKERKLRVTGMVNVDALPEVSPKVDMAPDIKRGLVRKYRSANKQLDAECKRNPSKLQELEKLVVDTHAYKRRAK